MKLKSAVLLRFFLSKKEDLERKHEDNTKEVDVHIKQNEYLKQNNKILSQKIYYCKTKKKFF